VAWLQFPFCFSRSYTSARSAFQRGASFAASMSMLCKCLFRCLEIGVRLAKITSDTP
jgi:hypothetical protein